MTQTEIEFAESIFRGSEIELWSFHPSHDGARLGLYLCPAGGPELHLVVPEKLMGPFLKSMAEARDTCLARLDPPTDLPERIA